MIPAELALTKSLIDIAVSADSFEEPDLARDVARLFLELTEDEAQHVGQALANAIAATAGDLFRWRALCDVAVRFDLYEVLAPTLSSFSRGTDPQQFASLATLSTNPAVSGGVRKQVQDAFEAADFETGVASVIRVRLGSETPLTPLQSALDRQVWPGRHSARELRDVSPLVYVAEDNALLSDVLKVTSAVVDAGGRVRRVRPKLRELKQPSWASADYPLVAWTGSAVARWRDLSGTPQGKTVVPGQDLDQPVVLARLLNQIESRFPDGVRFRNPAREGDIKTHHAFTPDLLDEGAFDALEMAYLGGASRSTLHRLVKDASVLAPSSDRGGSWRFDQLITVRLIQAFKAHNGRFRAAKGIADRLREIAAASEQSEVAIDATGRLYVRSEGEFVTLEGRQPAIDGVLSVDEALRTFTLGAGRVPNLLLPSMHTSVHPGVLAGTPALRDRRVSARAIAVFAERGDRALRSAFPELQPQEIRDGIEVGGQILAKRG